MNQLLSIASKTHFRNRLFLVVLGLLLFLPWLGSVHLFDWDEINFAEASREMILTGDYLRPQIDFKPFWEKPPLFFWLQVVSMRVWGINEFAARFVNAIVGIITLLAVYTFGRGLYGARFGLFWALAFCGSILPQILFKSGVIDPWFNLFILLGIAALSRSNTAGSPRTVRPFAMAGLWIGLSVLTKGPAAFGVAVLCWGVYWATGRFIGIARLKDGVVFLGVVAGVTFLFYGTETLLHGTWFLREFIEYHLRLFGTSEAGHGQPFYFHPLVLLFGCFPLSILAVFGFGIGRKMADTGSPEADFNRWMAILFWVVLVVFSIAKTKTVLYSSLCYFPLTYFGALFLLAVAEGKQAWTRRHTAALACVGVPMGIIISALPQLMVHKKMILPFITDRFSAGCVERAVAWSGWESLAGVAWLAALGLALILLCSKHVRTGIYTLLIGGSLAIQLVTVALAAKIEDHFQGAPIAFYQSLAGKDCYIRPLFKTYAHLFYSRKMPPQNQRSSDREWLLSGPIDKPAYFVDRIYKGEETARRYGLTVLKIDGGFVFMLRLPNLRGNSGSVPEGD
jgi:4-amino-4-deoxy-L-arabinose transferase-like glycosyltransferase